MNSINCTACNKEVLSSNSYFICNCKTINSSFELELNAKHTIITMFACPVKINNHWFILDYDIETPHQITIWDFEKETRKQYCDHEVLDDKTVSFYFSPTSFNRDIKLFVEKYCQYKSLFKVN